MGYSDDEYEFLKPNHVSRQIKHGWIMEIIIHTVSFIVVMSLYKIIFAYKPLSIADLEKSILTEIEQYRIKYNLSTRKNLSNLITKAPHYGDNTIPMNKVKNLDPLMVAYLRFRQEKTTSTTTTKTTIDKYTEGYENTCTEIDWVRCNGFYCRLIDEVLNVTRNIVCNYSDIVHVSENYYYIDKPEKRLSDQVYAFYKSDHVKVTCEAIENSSLPETYRWTGVVSGFRPIYVTVPNGRYLSPNVLILAFDSLTHDELKKVLPHFYDYLLNGLGAVVFSKYNIPTTAVLDNGTSLGKGDFSRNIYLYPDNYLFKCLHKDGYYTAYNTDLPVAVPRSNKFDVNYDLKDFFDENYKIMSSRKDNTTSNPLNCVGDDPKPIFLLAHTRKFTAIPVKRFSFTLISNITSTSTTLMDKYLFKIFEVMKKESFYNTLFILMTNQRQSKLTSNDNKPVVFIILPQSFINVHDEALIFLRANKDADITPYDIDMTILDVVGMPNWKSDYYKFGRGRTNDSLEIPEGKTLLEPRF